MSEATTALRACDVPAGRGGFSDRAAAALGALGLRPLVVAFVPGLRLASLNATLREDPRRRHGRQARLCARLAPFVWRAGPRPPTGAVRVVLVRVAPRAYDSDRFAGGDATAVRDWLATAYLGRRDDKDGAALAWRYEQVAGAVREYGLVVAIERAEGSEG